MNIDQELALARREVEFNPYSLTAFYYSDKIFRRAGLFQELDDILTEIDMIPEEDKTIKNELIDKFQNLAFYFMPHPGEEMMSWHVFKSYQYDPSYQQEPKEPNNLEDYIIIASMLDIDVEKKSFFDNVSWVRNLKTSLNSPLQTKYDAAFLKIKVSYFYEYLLQFYVDNYRQDVYEDPEIEWEDFLKNYAKDLIR